MDERESGRSKSARGRDKTKREKKERDNGEQASADGSDEQTAAADGIHTETDLIDRLHTILDHLEEKRSSAREEGYKSLIKEMSRNYCDEFAESKFSTVLDIVMASLRKGGEQEVVLAARALSIFTITSGNAEVVFNQFLPVLRIIMKDHSSFPARAAAADTLAMVCFMSGLEESKNTECVNFFEEFIGLDGCGFHESALNGWSLLLTTLPAHYINCTIFPHQVQAVTFLLTSEDLDVRLAAGKALALLIDYQRGAADEEDGELDLSAVEQLVDTDEIIASLKSLAADNSRYMARKDKLKQRSFFREILASIESGETPEESLTINQSKVVVNSWPQIVQLHALRHALAEGLQTHLMHNPVLWDMFSVQAQEDAVRLSAVEKRHLKSPNSMVSKSKTQIMKKQRSHKTVVYE